MIIGLLTGILKELQTLNQTQKESNKLLMTIDERIKAFSDTVNAQLATIGTNLTNLAGDVTNIAADEANLLEQIKQLTAATGTADLSAEAQQLLQGVTDSLTTMATNSNTVANNAKALADSVPDAVAPPPTV